MEEEIINEGVSSEEMPSLDNQSVGSKNEQTEEKTSSSIRPSFSSIKTALNLQDENRLNMGFKDFNSLSKNNDSNNKDYLSDNKKNNKIDKNSSNNYLNKTNTLTPNMMKNKFGNTLGASKSNNNPFDKIKGKNFNPTFLVGSNRTNSKNNSENEEKSETGGVKESVKKVATETSDSVKDVAKGGVSAAKLATGTGTVGDVANVAKLAFKTNSIQIKVYLAIAVGILLLFVAIISCFYDASEMGEDTYKYTESERETAD